MRCVFKILLLPVVAILSVIKLFLEGATKLYCLVVGIAINLLVVCSVLAIITKQWFALAVFGIIFVAIMAILFSAGSIVLVLDRLKYKLLRI